MGSLIFAFLVLWYVNYRLCRKDFKKNTGKKLTFLGSFNPDNWHDM
jgi:hypothetical protein